MNSDPLNNNKEKTLSFRGSIRSFFKRRSEKRFSLDIRWFFFPRSIDDRAPTSVDCFFVFFFHRLLLDDRSLSLPERTREFHHLCFFSVLWKIAVESAIDDIVYRDVSAHDNGSIVLARQESFDKSAVKLRIWIRRMKIHNYTVSIVFSRTLGPAALEIRQGMNQHTGILVRTSPSRIGRVVRACFVILDYRMIVKRWTSIAYTFWNVEERILSKSCSCERKKRRKKTSFNELPLFVHSFEKILPSLTKF